MEARRGGGSSRDSCGRGVHAISGSPRLRGPVLSLQFPSGFLGNKNTIGRIISKALLSGRDVDLPGLGILKAQDVAARREKSDAGSTWHAPRVAFVLTRDPSSEAEG